MTGEHFINYLEDPEQLALINYEELRTLTLAYPYAHNLRYLLALKARLEDKPEYPKLLAAAAAYSLDRRRLLALVSEPVLVPQPVAQAREEVLELKPLTDLLQKLDLQKQELQTAPLTAQVEAARLPEADNPVPAPPPPHKAPKPIEDPYADWLANFVPASLANADRPEDPRCATEAPSPDAAAKEHTPSPKSRTPNPAPKSRAQQLAEQSVTPNAAVASETLAGLLARQGHIERAIAMYEKLSQQYPEKSANFAALIEALKK
ncbi:MAG: hypothetical protein ACK4NS_09865 [Saprospiraceae bacterium]